MASAKPTLFGWMLRLHGKTPMLRSPLLLSLLLFLRSDGKRRATAASLGAWCRRRPGCAGMGWKSSDTKGLLGFAST